MLQVKRCRKAALTTALPQIPIDIILVFVFVFKFIFVFLDAVVSLASSMVTWPLVTHTFQFLATLIALHFTPVSK